MKKMTTLAAASVLMAGSAFAQVSGTLGTSSEADVSVEATIAKMVRIGGLDGLMEVAIDAARLNSNFGQSRESQRFCVYSNVNSTGDYLVEISSSNPRGPNGNPYVLTNGTENLNYYVHFNDDFANPFNFINPGIQYSRSTTAGGLPRPTDLDCGNVSGGENAELVVGFRNSQVLAVPAGTYSGMLTITVSAP